MKSPRTETPAVDLHERHSLPSRSPWGPHEDVILRTRQNITRYAYAVSEKLRGGDLEKALVIIRETRSYIRAVERRREREEDVDLPSFLQWLKHINVWMMEQREFVIHSSDKPS